MGDPPGDTPSAVSVAGRRPPAAAVVVGIGGASALVGGLVLLAPRLGLIWPASTATQLVGLGGLLVGMAFATAGLGLVVFRPVLAGPAAAAAGFGSHRVALAVTAFATLTAALAGGLTPLLVLKVTGQQSVHSVPVFVASALSVSLVLLVTAYLRFVRPGVVSMADFGLGRNRLADRLGGQVWLAHLVTGFGGGLLVLATSGGVQVAMSRLGVEQTQLLDFTWVRELAMVDFAMIWLVGAVLGPFSEEVFFRGIVFRGYLQAKGPRTAYLASAVVFALLHLNLQAFPPILVLGLVLAWLYRSTQSLLPCMVAHGFNNGVAFLVLRFGTEALS
jgi:membrane protease YdiL (CAAX protease family)